MENNEKLPLDFFGGEEAQPAEPVQKPAEQPKEDPLVKLSFEEALKQLEEVTVQLERGELALEQSISLFHRGMKLSALCQKRLDDAQQRIAQLLPTADGWVEEDMAEHNSGY